MQHVDDGRAVGVDQFADAGQTVFEGARQARGRCANRPLRVVHALQRDSVEQSGVEREQYGDLVRNGKGSKLWLFQRRANPPAVFDCFAGGLIETCAEAGERLQLLKLRIGELDVAGDRTESGCCALPPTRETDFPTSTAGSTPSSNSDGER